MGRELLVLCILCVTTAPPGHAVWSSDPATNLPVADGPGEQILPKVAPTPDGGCYVSWFDNGSGGYDVRVQKLDVQGNEVFDHNGVLVADRGFSWVMDYGLDVDATGNAIVTFRDDRFTGEQITAAMVTPTGSLAWGPSGVQLTSTTAFIATPKIAGTSDGEVVVAWTQDNDAWVQKLDPTGQPVWDPAILFTPSTGSYSVSDLHDAGSSVILSLVHQIGDFGSPRHIVAQKLDASGNPEWGPDPVAVFDGGSLQFGNFPPFLPDGVGGGVFTWYDTSTLQFQSYAQRILSDGTEAFPHNGTAVSANLTRVRVSPSPAFDVTTGETIVFWVEQTSNQAQSGVYGQKLDASGSRQWTDDGVVLVPIGTDAISLVRGAWTAAGAFAFWSEAPAFGQDRLYGARVDDDGSIEVGPFDVASTPSGKSRLDVAPSVDGMAILVWADERNGPADLLAQNVNPDGSLGIPGVAVESGPGDPSMLLGMPYPNPVRGSVTFSVASSASTPLEIAIHDARGGLVRLLSRRTLGDGAVVTWDGRNGRGNLVPPGVYFVRVTDAGEWTGRRVTILR